MRPASEASKSWREPESRAFARRWLGLALALGLAAAFFSFGYHDSDEQFQVLEFLNARLGRSSVDALPWEHGARMRSWLQPMLYEAVARAMLALGVDDPFRWATGMRLLSAGLGWGSLVALARCCHEWFAERRAREWAIRLTCVFFLTPYLHARTSSENLGGTLFVLGVAAQVLGRSAWATGALLGLSFLARYQIGFALVGFGAWLAFVRRESLSRIARLCGGFALALVAGLALDAWGYGAWTLTPWNYFYQNLVAGRAAAFGTSPWDHYIFSLNHALEPMGSVLMLGVALAWTLRPKHVLSLASAVFCVGHSLIAHKEQRFLYPMATLAPVLFVLGAQALGERLRWAEWPAALRGIKRGLAVAAGALLAYDVGALLVLTFKPASAHVAFYRDVYRHEPPIPTLHYRGLDPYAPTGARVNYYRRPGLETRPLGDYAELASRLVGEKDELWLFHERDELEGEAAVLRDHCRLESSVFSPWLRRLTFLPALAKHANRWSLFRCGPMG